MEVRALDIVNSIDINKSDALMPIYECVVNSIISLYKVEGVDKYIKVLIDRSHKVTQEDTLFGKSPAEIENVTIVDNGEGFTEKNFQSFKAPYSNFNKKYGCKGVGRFTVLALFEKIEVVSIYEEYDNWYRREFVFDAENEIQGGEPILLEGEYQLQTKVKLSICHNVNIKPYTARSSEDIAKGLMEHCFIYHLSGTLPLITIADEGEKPDTYLQGVSVNELFTDEAKDKERDIKVKGEDFHLYILHSKQVTSRRYNYVYLCANSRVVGEKYDLAKTNSLYAYPIMENGEAKYIDVYVVSAFLDKKVNNQRTAISIPEELGSLQVSEDVISKADIYDTIANEIEDVYKDFVIETKKKNIEEIKTYIQNNAPQYRSFLKRMDILDVMPPHMSEEKKEEYLHKIAVLESQKIDKKINDFIAQKDVNEDSLTDLIYTMREKSAYDSDALTEYVMRRRAVLRLFRSMLDRKDDGKYHLEEIVHNLIFPMGFTNEDVGYPYHNLWILDDRFSTYKYIGSDKSITSISQKNSRKEPDIVMFNGNTIQLLDNPSSFGNKDSGELNTMVVFEFKRPGDTAHQKRKTDMRWEFSELVEVYFENFLYGTEKEKKNYRGNVVTVNNNTPKFGFVIMDEMPIQLIEYNKGKGWRQSPFGSYYKINPDQHLHIEAITFQKLLENAEDRNNPFFDHLFTSRI